METIGNNGAPNDKVEHKVALHQFFKQLSVLWLASGCLDVRDVLAFDIIIRALNLILRLVVVSFTPRKCLFQQDIARLHVDRRVLTYPCKKGIRLLPCPSQSPDLLTH
ncbi:hypothetical protein TNCV_3905501 [Trichonephila clavipes]|nr:hypothetical protein TNCV_3905501 [Trichonephila clavipes]